MIIGIFEEKKLIISSKNVGAMIHWIRQIKEVVNTQSFDDVDDWSGPLDEIAFWKARSMLIF